MSQFVDGFVFPIPCDRVAEYQRIAASVAEIWKEHGALGYHEVISADVSVDGTRQFDEVLEVRDNETVVFGWVLFESVESRDQVHERVASDPRMADLVAPLTDPADPVFDASRMVYGGFLPLVL